MSSKIGICGAQSVGKTTLLNALKQEKRFSDYKFCDEVTRWVGKLGLPINEQGTDDTQFLIAMKHIYNLRLNDRFITDRTIIDCYVYSKWLYNKGKLSEACLNEIHRIAKTIISDYNQIFYIKPEFEIKDDGVRSTDLSFRDEIVTLFEDALFEFLDNDYIILSGSVDERVKQFKGNIK